MAKRGPPARGNRLPPPYGRQHALVLVNGLAEQPETWFRNHRVWQRFPAWYHVSFILSLVLFTLLGAMRRIPR